MLNFVWTNQPYVLEIVLVLLYFEWKLNKTRVIVKFNAILGVLTTYAN